MEGYEWIGYGAVLAAVFALVAALASARVPTWLKHLLILALALRVVGAFVRHFVLFEIYGGVGDAVLYFDMGQLYANRLARLDFGMFLNPWEWEHGRWWGTNFVYYVSAFVQLLIGPTMRGEFLAFGLLSLVGLLVLGLRAARTSAGLDAGAYLLFLWAWPSLWFWPSGLGKDAIVMMGLGLATAGYLGNGKRVGWLLLALGLAAIFAIRPQVAAVVVVALMLAQWLSFKEGWTLPRVLQGAFFLAVVVGVGWWASRLVGIGEVGVEGVQNYLAQKAGDSAVGGADIGAVGFGPLSVPMALINVWLRPFLWEAHNPLVLASGLEMVALWGLFWHRRRHVGAALRDWRRSRLLRLAIPFVLLYSVLLGLSLANLSIISRQRIFIFPFLFALLAWEAPGEKTRRRAPRQAEAVGA